MTISIFTRELLDLPELRSDNPKISSEESHTSENADLTTLEGSAKALATARKIFTVAKLKYGWSDRQIEDLQRNVREHLRFDKTDRTGRDLILVEAGSNLAWIAEKSSDLSYWIALTPKQRDVLFYWAKQLQNEYSKSNKISLIDRLYLWQSSIRYSVNFTQFFLDIIESRKKIVDNALRMETIFERRKGSKTRVLNFSNMTPAEREIAIESNNKKRRERYNFYTNEELEESDRQFDRMFELLEESRK
jgi:hypothetical protein